MLIKIRKVLGVSSLQEQLNEYKDIEKAEKENVTFREVLANEQYSQLIAFNSRHSLNDIEKAHIEKRYKDFQREHKKEFKKAFNQFKDLQKRKKSLFNDSELRKAVVLDKYINSVELIRRSVLSEQEQQDLIKRLTKKIIKANSGYYSDTTSNKKGGIVGFPYGHKNIIHNESEEEKADKEIDKSGHAPEQKQAAKEKIRKVMQEFRDGTLKDSEGKRITSSNQALAVALSEAGINDINKANKYIHNESEDKKNDIDKQKTANKEEIKTSIHDWARKSTESQLVEATKSGDEDHRVIAHRELERRKQEEHPKQENKEEETTKQLETKKETTPEEMLTFLSKIINIDALKALLNTKELNEKR